MRPTLVLLPGLDGTGRLFDPLLQAMPADWPAQVVRYPVDQPLGYGALLPLVLASLPAAAPYVLVGESFGGPLALRAAVLAPHRPLAVVLSATFIRNPSWAWPRLLEAFAPLAGWVPPWLRARFLLGRSAQPAVEGILDEIQGQVDPAVFHTRLLEVLRVDASEALVNCPCPILYLRGERDRTVPANALRVIQSVRPDVEAAILPTGHLLLQCLPQIALQAIEAFLVKHSAS